MRETTKRDSADGSLSRLSPTSQGASSVGSGRPAIASPVPAEDGPMTPGLASAAGSNSVSGPLQPAA